MSKELRTPADAPEVAPLVEARIIESQELTQERNASVKALATQLHYDGSLSVGALEDEIRFYQRRTVEACLELGKRLLLLKEITPHGEFTQRAELLGFSDRTARRFMQAAAKTAKSANLAVLSTQVKSASAFLELVTEDDDTLKAVSEMDEVDRMSATELRAAVRMARQHADDAEQQVARKDAKINELDRKLNVRVRQTHLETAAVIEDRPHEGDRGDDGTLDRWRAPAAARVQRRFQGVGSGSNP